MPSIRSRFSSKPPMDALPEEDEVAPPSKPRAKAVAAEVKVDDGIAGMVRVNLKDKVVINSVQYGPGKDILVPAECFEVWRHARED